MLKKGVKNPTFSKIVKKGGKTKKNRIGDFFNFSKIWIFSL